MSERSMWASMMQRCYNPRAVGYDNYGGRGIKVCRRWHKFENFVVDMGQRPDGMSLDRINNDKGYNKRNCRWADATTQAENRRSNSIVWGGYTIPELAAEMGVRQSALRNQRYVRGSWQAVVDAYNSGDYRPYLKIK